MLTDILDGCLDETVWEETVENNSKEKETGKDKKKGKEKEKMEKKERKKKEEESSVEKSDSDFVEEPKRKKKRKVESASREKKKGKKKVMVTEVESSEDVSDKESEAESSEDEEVDMPVGQFVEKVKKRIMTQENSSERSALLPVIQLLSSKIDAIDQRVTTFVGGMEDNVQIPKEKEPVGENPAGNTKTKADEPAVKKNRVRKS